MLMNAEENTYICTEFPFSVNQVLPRDPLNCFLSCPCYDGCCMCARPGQKQPWAQITPALPSTRACLLPSHLPRAAHRYVMNHMKAALHPFLARSC